MSDPLEFNTLVGRQLAEFGYTTDIDGRGIWVIDGGPIAVIHHEGDGVARVNYFNTANEETYFPNPGTKLIFLGDVEWTSKLKALLICSKRLLMESKINHGQQKRS